VADSPGVERLALGTAQLGLPYGVANRGARVSSVEARRIVDRASAAGVTTLDTAMSYGDSEGRLGDIGVQRWRVVSKLPAVPDLGHRTSRWIRDRIRDSLQQLRIEKLYGLLLHKPGQLLEANGQLVYEALRDSQDEGLVHKIGISIYDPTELASLNGRYAFNLIQAPLSVMDRRFADTGWLSRCSEKAMEVHVRSIFLQGLLLMQPQDLPRRFARWRPLWNAWHGWLAESGLTPVQACVRHVLSHTGVSKIIVGVDSTRQLDEVLAAFGGPPLVASSHLQSVDPNLIDPSRWPQRVRSRGV
jgi:aryl-alcohol dehydrogenase-like predicted oxidoreductase